ncbi:MAG TPA: hypothetical protein VF598_13695 [Hymenobacter sp.]|jgi:hypothetical protein
MQQDQNSKDVAYWCTKTVEERMAGLEALRLKTYIEEQAKLGNIVTEMPRMQRIVRIIRRQDKS